MPNLTTLPHKLDVKKRACRAIIETPKGSRNKFDYDPASNLFKFLKAGIKRQEKES